MSSDPEHKPLEDLLSPQIASPTPEFRQAVLRQTTGVLRRRVWIRRTTWAAALAACYLAGVLTARLFTPAVQPNVVREEPAPPAPAPVEPALAMENRALDSTIDRHALYRQAGDQYLNEEQDPESALRCYRQSLRSDPADLEIKPDDNWLLIVVKESRRKEKEDAAHP